MKIIVDKEVVGELTDDREIINEDICLKRSADTMKKRRFEDIERVEGKEGTYCRLITVKKGDAGYASAVASFLLNNGYGLVE